MGEAKASGNLGNTLKVLQRFDEAVVCCQRHLDIAQEQGDKVRPRPWPTAPAQARDRGLRDTRHSRPPALAPGEGGGRAAPLRNEGAFCACRHWGAEAWLPKPESAAPIFHGCPPLTGLPPNLPAPHHSFRGPERR